MKERTLLLKNKVALVTAGASGMGRAAAELFAENGAHVIVVDMNEPQAQRAGLPAMGGIGTASSLGTATR